MFHVSRSAIEHLLRCRENGLAVQKRETLSYNSGNGLNFVHVETFRTQFDTTKISPLSISNEAKILIHEITHAVQRVRVYIRFLISRFDHVSRIPIVDVNIAVVPSNVGVLAAFVEVFSALFLVVFVAIIIAIAVIIVVVSKP